MSSINYYRACYDNAMRPLLKIGLTGGIGSGKSTAAKYFAKLNVPIIDADEIAHELLKPNTTIYKKIISHFNKKNLTRKNIRRLIFSDTKERLWLEKLTHAHIRTEMEKRAASLKVPYCIMVVPLFFETKYPPKVDRILVIDCVKKNQIKHTLKRKSYSTNQIKAIIAAQVDRKERLMRANDIIYNTSTVTELKKMVKKLHEHYKKISD